MKYREGEIVRHKLTKERLIVLGLFPGKKYRCRNHDGVVVIYEEVELEDL